jgi:hypothetical protein
MVHGHQVIRTRDPVLLPHRLRVLSAAKRVEGVGSDAGAVLGPGVVQAKHLGVGIGALPLV